MLKTHSTHCDLIATVASTVPVSERRTIWRSPFSQDLQLSKFLAGEFKLFHDIPLIGGKFLEQKVFSNLKVQESCVIHPNTSCIWCSTVFRLCLLTQSRANTLFQKSMSQHFPAVPVLQEKLQAKHTQHAPPASTSWHQGHARK